MAGTSALPQTASRASLPPGPRAPSLIQAMRLLRDPVGYMERCRARWGPVFRFDYPGAPPLAYVSEPAMARALYARDRVNRAGEARLPYLGPLVGDSSVLCLEGEEWLRHRKLLAPPMNGERIVAWREEIAAIAAAEVDSWPDGELRLRPRMQAITLEVILRLVFGVSERERQDRLRELLPELLEAVDSVVFGIPPLRERLSGRLGRAVPFNPVRRFERVRAAADAEIYAEIAERRREAAAGSAAPGERADMLSMLLAARDEEGEAMSDVELRDELVTLLTAGHETTATALAWLFERLVRHPEVGRRLVAEADAGDDTTYLDAVIRESLRTRPVVFDTPRLLTEPLEVGGFTVPAGWWAAPAIPLVHGSDDLMDDPATFDPDRFLGDETPVRGWIPFGGGKRRCLGTRLAMLELQAVVPEVLRRRSLAAVEAADERQTIQHVTLSPGNGVLVRVERRRSVGGV